MPPPTQVPLDPTAAAAQCVRAKRVASPRALPPLLALLGILRTHVAHTPVLTQACAALCHAALDAEAAPALWRAGVWDALTSAMDAHPHSAAVQGWACSLLATVARGHPDALAALGAEGVGRIRKAACVAGAANAAQWALQTLRPTTTQP